LDAGPGTAAGRGDEGDYGLAVAEAGERGSADAQPFALPGDPDGWSAFFSSWALFGAASRGWAGRGLLPPQDFARRAPAVLRVRAFHFLGRPSGGDGSPGTPEQLRELHEQVVRTSPVGNIISRPVKVKAELNSG